MAVSPYESVFFKLTVRMPAERSVRFWGYVHDCRKGNQYADCETQYLCSHYAPPPFVIDGQEVYHPLSDLPKAMSRVVANRFELRSNVLGLPVGGLFLLYHAVEECQSLRIRRQTRR